MNKKQLYEEIGFIDDDLIQEAHQWKKNTSHSIGFLKWVPAVACLALVILGGFMLRNSSTTQKITITYPNNNSNTSEPTNPGDQTVNSDPSDVSTPATENQYELILNKANGQSAADIYIPGHFWEELTENELQAILPKLQETYNLSATANFNGDGALFNVDVTVDMDTDEKAYIQLAPGEVTLDYILDTDEVTSDIMGVAVTAGYFDGTNNGKTIYFANFTLDDVGYYVEITGGDSEKEIFLDIIVRIISGGSADFTILDPVIPELREDYLTLKEAYADTDFGEYLPTTLPSDFVFESALRFINQENNYLNVNWTQGMDYIECTVSYLNENDKNRITSVTDTQNYDLSLYPIPHADSVPEELSEIVDNPIFYIEDLTLDVVKARSYKVDDSGDSDGYRMNFSVLYDNNILVDIRVKGATPEDIFEALLQ